MSGFAEFYIFCWGATFSMAVITTRHDEGHCSPFDAAALLLMSFGWPIALACEISNRLNKEKR